MDLPDKWTLRLGHLPKILLVRVQGSETASRAYWAGHWLGTIGRMKTRNIWGWKMADGSAGGKGGDRGDSLTALWKCWEDKYGEKETTDES